MRYGKRLVILILVASVIRCFVAASIELGNDEVYYWTYSQYLQWNYFDHPPFVALLIRLTTWNLSLQQFELFVRLGSIVCSGLATYFIYRCVMTISTERAAFIAAILYTASFYGSVIAGIFILPDSPQMLFWTAGLWCLSIIVSNPKPASWLQWCVFGLLAGLAAMSKIHSGFIWTGLLLYAIFFRREFLKSAKLYISALITIVIFLPVVIWNMQNHFITYRYHSSRLTGIEFKTDNFFREIFGEVFYNNPVNFWLTIAAIVWLATRFRRTGHDFLKVSMLISLPMIVLLLCLSMFNDTLPHWSGPAYVALIPLAAVYISEYRVSRSRPLVPYYALGLTMMIAGIAVPVIKCYPGTMGVHHPAAKLGQGDVTLDMYGWSSAGRGIDSLVLRDERKHKENDDAEFIAAKWFPAAHIDYYIARPIHKFVIGLGTMSDLHHYEWLNRRRLGNRLPATAYCVLTSNYPRDAKLTFGNQFKSIEYLGSLPSYRGNRICRYFLLYRMKDLLNSVPNAGVR